MELSSFIGPITMLMPNNSRLVILIFFIPHCSSFLTFFLLCKSVRFMANPFQFPRESTSSSAPLGTASDCSVSFAIIKERDNSVEVPTAGKLTGCD